MYYAPFLSNSGGFVWLCPRAPRVLVALPFRSYTLGTLVLFPSSPGLFLASWKNDLSLFWLRLSLFWLRLRKKVGEKINKLCPLSSWHIGYKWQKRKVEKITKYFDLDLEKKSVKKINKLCPLSSWHIGYKWQKRKVEKMTKFILT